MGTPKKQTAGVAPQPVADVTFVVKDKDHKQAVRGVQFRGDTLKGEGALAEREWPGGGKTGPSGKVQIKFLVGHVRVLVQEPGGSTAVGLARFDRDAKWAVVHDGPMEAGKRTIEVVLEWKKAAKVDWEPITSSKVFVGKNAGGERPFPDWFNGVFRPAHSTDFPHKIEKAGFTNTFDSCAKWDRPQLTGREFVAYVAIMYNETGGRFASVIEPNGGTELKDVAYCFEKRGGKRGYNNVEGNQKAGNRLRNDPNLPRPLTDAEVALWNGDGPLPPDEPPGVHLACRECDFWKYRGHGHKQLTGRAITRLCAGQLLGEFAGVPGAANTDATLDALTWEQVDEAFRTDDKVIFGSLANFLKMRGAQTDAVNAGNWAPFGTAVAGSSDYGEGIYTRRCQALFDAMEKDGVRVESA